jgi:uncharacterized protein (DUF983 family)
VQPAPAVPQPSRPALVGRALRRRCPVCGSRGLFTGWFRMVERCPTCGLASDREVGHWIGAIGINTIVSFALLGVVLVVGFVLTYPDIAVGPILLASLATAVLVPLIMWPYSQTLWMAIDLMMRPVRPEELDPRYLGR